MGPVRAAGDRTLPAARRLSRTHLVHLIRFSLSGNAPPTRAQAALLTDAVWSHAVPPLRLEHVTVTACTEGFDVVVFLRDDMLDPGRAAAAIIGSLCESTRLSLSYMSVPEPATVDSAMLRDLLGDHAEPPESCG